VLLEASVSAQNISTAHYLFRLDKTCRKLRAGRRGVAVQGVPGILSGAVIAISPLMPAGKPGQAPGNGRLAIREVYRQRQPKVGPGAMRVPLYSSTWSTPGVRYSVRSGRHMERSGLADFQRSGWRLPEVAVDGSGNAVAAYVSNDYQPWNLHGLPSSGRKLPTQGPRSNSSTQVVATPAGTFVAGGNHDIDPAWREAPPGTRLRLRIPRLVNAAAGLAIAVGAPQVSVSTAAVP